MELKVSSECECGSVNDYAKMLSVLEAQECAESLIDRPVQSELVQLNNALGRVASRDLRASRPLPFFDNSAMDGFAISTSSLASPGPWSLPIVGLAAAGCGVPKSDGAVLEGTMRILTGARVPEGFDAVIAQELCRVEGDFVHINKCPQPGENIRYAGSDTQRNALLVGSRTRIQPHLVGLLAASGYGTIEVRKMPKVAILSTGDELAKPGDSVEQDQIYDCNKPMLAAFVAAHGAEVTDLGCLPDDLSVTTQLLKSCRTDYDLIISTGSVSVGDRDFLKTAFKAAGGDVRNWKVAVKPGKPVLFGKLGKAAFTGLPGNPFAAYVGFQLFVKRQLQLLSGEKIVQNNLLKAVADFSWERKAGREEYFPVSVNRTNVMELNSIRRLGNSVSATLFPLAAADGLGRVPADCTKVEPGDFLQWQAI